MSITMDRPEWTDLDEQSLSKQPMLPQAMAQLIVSQSQRFGGRALVETMLIERRLQNRHFMRIDSGAEITDVIKETRLFLSRNNELGFVRRSEEHKSELQSLMRISYAVFCLQKK